MFASDSRRPWGTYSVLESSERYKMKRIVVKPSKRLSQQKRLHRSEHCLPGELWAEGGGLLRESMMEKEKI